MNSLANRGQARTREFEMMKVGDRVRVSTDVDPQLHGVGGVVVSVRGSLCVLLDGRTTSTWFLSHEVEAVR